ncbi:hypothetical protein ACHAXR_008282 [Thalassiosira sp. AJA248-18]
MDAIPTSKRRQALERALLGEDNAAKAGSDSKLLADYLGGHEKARSHRRTGGLSFCPKNGSATAAASESNTANNLVEMEFILSLEPSVRVLHSYYLADALGLDSSMIYEELKRASLSSMGDLGSYTSDTILNEIDRLNKANNDEGLTLDQVESIVQSHLPASLVDRQHLCLLHQYTLNKSPGRSIRGTTEVYDRPHVSTFYRSKFPSSASNNNALATPQQQVVEPNYKVPPASLTFTGYAAKFINLSLKPLNLYWEGGRIPSGPRAGEMHTVLVGTIPSMESIGTSSFPGHTFYVTPTYDKDHNLKRWTITEDEPILYYDPLADLSAEGQLKEMAKLTREGKWTEKQRFGREAWMVDRSFGRDYLVKTGRVWLANFPLPYLNVNGDNASLGREGGALAPAANGAGTMQDGHRMHMWEAGYIGQTHTLDTPNLYYTALPETLERLTKEDFLPKLEEQRRLEMRQFQSSSLKGKKTDNSNDTLPLTLKVLSCAPRVLEAKKFLSSVEVQHLIDLASGAKGDVVMEHSTVSASNVNGSSKKVRGSKADARSSTGGWIHREQDTIVDTIFRRIADLLNIDEHLMRDQARDSGVEEGGREPLPTHDRIVEAMQLLRYGPGEEYSAHHDFTYPSIENRYQPKRYATILLYLTGEGDVVENGIRQSTSSSKNTNNDLQHDLALKGGETMFPRAITTDYHDGVKVEPQSGKAILFYNVLPDGNMDDLSQHSGGKVEKGVKYIANVWVWDPIVN